MTKGALAYFGEGNSNLNLTLPLIRKIKAQDKSTYAVLVSGVPMGAQMIYTDAQD